MAFSSANVNTTANGANISQPTDIKGVSKNLLFTTSANLGVSANYAAPTFDASAFKTILGFVMANQAGTIYVQESDDQISWYTTNTIAVTASTQTSVAGTNYYNAQTFSQNLASKWFRIYYVNSTTAQTAFNFSVYSIAL